MSHYSSRNSHPYNYSPDYDSSPAPSSGTHTPTGASAGSSAFLSSSVSGLWGGLIRRFSSDTPSSTSPSCNTSFQHSRSYPSSDLHNGIDSVYTPPQHTHRAPSPMALPPLEPLQLNGFAEDTTAETRLLTPAIAEEIRIMVPARLSLVDEWNLVYGLEQDGASLATLYDKCAAYQGKRVGFVLVVKDCEGGIFGAYLSDYPHPAPKYFGTGECFLWRASVLASLPPPPSADTTHLATRTTTIASGGGGGAPSSHQNTSSLVPPSPSIRFKAFPYSGVNEYYMLCETHFLSVGAGDGKYGLWLNDNLEKGISSTCQTFGNERLSDVGEKFGILGVEVWVIGA
ncbi:oxidation resistance protein 1 [Lasiosphaeria hispida]|uniref:Oxidation resistance protein 1 n=1 Tax=Lasiosphaeria hispida TaxID=260671 RepID=A0AAJ0MAG2_9PEZI|nr:oxidation resistance protein 1 [Lasiosphaeria hispida]